MKKEESYLKRFAIGLLAIVMYYILLSIQTLPFDLLKMDIATIPLIIKILWLLVYELLILCVLIMIFNKIIIQNFDDLKKNHKKYFKDSFKYYLIGLAVMIIGNLIIVILLNKGVNANEEAIRSIFKISPLYIYISGVIFAPITEELIFRQSIKNIIPNKYIFIIVSGLCFGYAHLSGNIVSLSDLLYLIPYCGLGMSFAYMLVKTKNIYVPIGFHLMHNGILIALQFVILFFK